MPTGKLTPSDVALEVRLTSAKRNTITGPGTFCDVLLRRGGYVLPAHVNQELWLVALRYYAEVDPTPDVFRRSLGRRSQQHEGRLDGGARVASYLLSQWDLYLKGWAQAQSSRDIYSGVESTEVSYEYDNDDAYQEIDEELADLTDSFARSESTGWFYADSDPE